MSNIEWGMEVTLTGDEKVKGQYKALDKTVDGTADSLDDVSGSANAAADKLEKTGKKAEKAGKKAKESKSWWRALYGEFFSLKGLIGGIGLGLLTQQIIEVGNVTQGWQASMFAVTGSHVVANAELQHSRELAKHLGADIKSTTNSYVQFTAATQGTALQGFKTTKVFDAVSGAMRVLNRSADDTAGALKALEQMVSKGTVQAEELKGQLGERLPGAFRLAADAMGVTTMQLGKMLEGGNVLAEDLLPKLADVLTQKYGAGLETALNSPAQAFRNLTNASFEFYEGLSNSLFDELAAGAQILADAMQAVIPHLPAIIGGLSSLVKIVAVSGALYLGYMGLAAIIPVVTTAMTGLTLATLRTRTATLLNTISLKLFNSVLFQTIAAVGLLKTAFFALAALYAGWEIGSWLSENFLEARLAGLAFVRAMEIGFAYLSFAFDVSMESIKFGWESSLNGMREMAGSFYSAIASGLSAIGADETAAIYTRAAASYTANITKVEDLNSKIKELGKERDKDIAKIDQTINSLVNHEIAVANGTKTLNKNTKADKKNIDGKAKELTANQKLITSLHEQIHMLGATDKQKLVNTNLAKLSAAATKAERDKVVELTEALYDQTEAYESLDLSDLTNQTNDYGTAWTNVGNVIIDTFGSIADKFTNLGEIQGSYIKQMDAIAVRRKAINSVPDIEQRTKGLKELKSYENSVIKQNTQAQLGAFGSIAGAASEMFSEQSKGRKALHALEMGFMAAEMILSIEKSILNATEAVTNAGSAGDPYTAPARVLAMSALMAGVLGAVGVAFGGGSGGGVSSATRQETQGTGTVLGSNDKSASINNSFERIEELSLDQYAELREMNTSLRDLNNNITQLTTSLVSDFGRFNEDNYTGQLGSNSAGFQFSANPIDLVGSIIGSFSSTKKTLVDSGISIVAQTMGDVIDTGLLQAQAYFDIKTKKKKFWGLSSKTSYNTEYQEVDSQFNHEFGLIIKNIGSTINSAVDVLGIDTQNSLDNYIINIGNISFKDLSSDEIQAQLEAMISSEADKMASYLLPGLQQFQVAGEGLYETLMRLAQEQAVFNSVLELTGNTMANIDATQTIEATQAIIGFAGGIEKLQSAANTFFNEFYSETEQFEYMQKSLNAQFNVLGETLPATRQGFKDLVTSLDLTNEADQRLYAQLLLLSGQTAEYYDAIENTIEKEAELTAARQAFTDDLQSQITRLDMSPLELALDDLNQRYIDDLAKAEALNADISLLETFYGKQRTSIIDKHLSDGEKAFEDSVTKIASELAKLLDAIGNTKNGIAAKIRDVQRAMGGFDELGYINGNINGLTSQLGQGTTQEQLDTIEQLSNAVNERYELELSSIQGLADAAQSSYDNELAHYQNIKGALKDVASFTKTFALSGASPLSASQRLGVASSNFYQDLSKALNEKDLDAITNITNSASAYRDEARSYWGSSSQFASVFNAIESGLNQVAALGIEVPEIPSAVNEYQTDAIALQSSTITELQGLNGLLDTLALDAQTQASEATQVLTEQWQEQQALMLEANELQKSALAEQQKTNQKLDQANQNSAQVIDLLQKSNSQANKNLKAAEELNNQLMARSGTNA